MLEPYGAHIFEKEYTLRQVTEKVEHGTTYRHSNVIEGLMAQYILGSLRHYVMKMTCVVVFGTLLVQHGLAQESGLSAAQMEFNEVIYNLENRFIYFEDKKSIISCIRQTYGPAVDTVTSPYDKVLFYEQLLNELYDSHVNLNTNTDKSYRLSAPIYVSEVNGNFRVANVFSQLQVDFPNIIDAEILAFNDLPFQTAIDEFPTVCHDKQDPEIRAWLANKVLAGRRDQPRRVTLRMDDGQEVTLDLDALKDKSYDGVLTSSIQDNIGYIRINNALGNMELIAAFEEALTAMKNTDALILDLRNTPDGGNTGVAEPVMGRFVAEERGYQICESQQQRYTRKVYPQGETYDKPLYVLVGRWTGSMAEGMAIGFDGMKRATIIGTEMQRLAGGMETVKFRNSDFGYRISFEKMYHLNGSLRETFVPKEYIDQQDASKDECLERAYALIKDRK